MMSTTRSDWEIFQSATQRGYVGGSYYNPVDELDEAGRIICGSDVGSIGLTENMILDPGSERTHFIARLYDALSAHLTTSELLFGLYENGSHRMAPFLYDPERLMEFEQQVSCGVLRRHGFYAIKNSRATDGLSREVG